MAKKDVRSVSFRKSDDEQELMIYADLRAKEHGVFADYIKKLIKEDREGVEKGYKLSPALELFIEECVSNTVKEAIYSFADNFKSQVMELLSKEVIHISAAREPEKSIDINTNEVDTEEFDAQMEFMNNFE